MPAIQPHLDCYLRAGEDLQAKLTLGDFLRINVTLVGGSSGNDTDTLHLTEIDPESYFGH